MVVERSLDFKGFVADCPYWDVPAVRGVFLILH